MKKSLLIVATLAFASVAQAGPGNPVRVITNPGTVATGPYTAVAYGVKRDAHGGTVGLYTRGAGETQAEADEQALRQCATVTEGYGCILTQ